MTGAHGGPWVQMALFCEKVLQERDGVLTLIRVVDRVTHQVVGPTAPSDMEPFEHELVLVVALKAGGALGRHEVRIDWESPDGLRHRGPIQSVVFESAERGVNILQHSRLRFTLEGLYWFDVYVDDQRVTRIPFRVVYERRVMPESPQ
jgi:hypothetical protein